MTVPPEMAIADATRPGRVARVASAAAIEIDRRLQHLATSRDATTQLAHALRQMEAMTVGDAIDAPPPLGRADLVHPATTQMLRALAEAAHAPNSADGDLVTSTREFLEQLERIEEITDRDELLKLQEICLAISQRAHSLMPNPFNAPHQHRILL